MHHKEVRRQKRRAPTDEGMGETLRDRLWAAAVAIPIFEISLLLAASGTGRRTGAYMFLGIPLWLHIAYVGAAAAIGLIFGFRGITWLLGHLFLTHFEQERDEKVTALLWLGLLCLAAGTYLLLQM